MHTFDTLAIHAGEEPDPATGALTPPIHTSAAFELPGFGPRLFDALLMESHQPPHAYVRWGHPTARMLGKKIAALERSALNEVEGTSLFFNWYESHRDLREH